MTPEEYEDQERTALQHLPNRLIQACRPVTFEQINYPTRTQDARSLWRWADVMHECRFERDFPRLLGGLKAPEWGLWQQVSYYVHNRTQAMGQPIVPRGSLLRAFNVFRQIQTHAPDCVLEIGPGSGYLAALLGLGGICVDTVEVSQAFYLWQNCLFDGLILGHRVHQIPWWEFYNQDQIFCKRDLVVANHCLCEMSQDCLIYVANLCRTWNVPIMCEGLGLQSQRTEREALKVFEDRGVKVLGIEFHAPADPCVSLEKVLAYQESLMGDPRTPDEKWLQGLYGKEYYS